MTTIDAPDPFAILALVIMAVVVYVARKYDL